MYINLTLITFMHILVKRTVVSSIDGKVKIYEISHYERVPLLSIYSSHSQLPLNMVSFNNLIFFIFCAHFFQYINTTQTNEFFKGLFSSPKPLCHDGSCPTSFSVLYKGVTPKHSSPLPSTSINPISIKVSYITI